MTFITTYLIIGALTALIPFGYITVRNLWDELYNMNEDLYDRDSFPVVVTVTFITFIVVWPYWWWHFGKKAYDDMSNKD